MIASLSGESRMKKFYAKPSEKGTAVGGHRRERRFEPAAGLISARQHQIVNYHLPLVVR